MIKTILLILTMFLFSSCINKHGISAKYYSDCNEYYDFQGYYHKECGKDDIVTYKKITQTVKSTTKSIGNIFTKKKPKPNVW